MPTTKISGLTELVTAPDSADKLVIVDTSDTTDALTGTTKFIQAGNLGYLSNVVEDTTPQLGGTLDANGNTIDMGVNIITDTKVGQWDSAYTLTDPTGITNGYVLTANGLGSATWQPNDGAGDLLAANNLSDLSNIATARTNLGLVIGVDVQAYDATIVNAADIGVTVQAYDATILKSANIGSTVQAYDAGLAYLDSLNFTNEATFKAGVNLEIGTDVQAYNANLTSWAGKTAPTGTVVGTSDTQTLTNKTVTGVVLDGGYSEEVFAVTGTTPALDPSNGSIQTWTLTGNSTPTDSLSAGESITLMIDDGTAYTITWPTMTWVNNAGAPPTLATTGYTVVALWKVSTTLYGAFVGNGT